MSRQLGAAQPMDVGGHALGIRVLGQGRPAFVCLHGLVDTGEIWERLAPPLARRGQVVLVDQRGHGTSDAPPGPYRRNDLAADVAAVLDRLGIASAIVLGHSMGGIVAMTTALASPGRIAGLVLLGTASQCSEKVAGWYEKIAQAGETEGSSGLARRIFGSDTGRQIQGDAQGIAWVTRTLKSLFDDPLTPKLGQIRCPVLLLVGEKDPMGAKASEIINDQIPHATLEVLAGRGHWTHVEAPDEVLTHLDGWLARHRLAGGG